jgi:hypothetical protein
MTNVALQIQNSILMLIKIQAVKKVLNFNLITNQLILVIFLKIFLKSITIAIVIVIFLNKILKLQLLKLQENNLNIHL